MKISSRGASGTELGGELDSSVGTPADAEATGDGTLIAITKRNRSLLVLILAALTSTLIVSGSISVGNTPTVNQGSPPWSVSFPTAQPVNCVTGCSAGGGNPNGQATMANSAPVVVASNQSAIAISGPNTNGQKTMANSAPVVVASDQSAIAVTATISGTPAVTLSGTSNTVKVSDAAATYTWASVKSAAPAANAVQATTGALTAGTYDFVITCLVSDTVAVGKGLVIEHRNSADAATLQNLGGCVPGDAEQFELRSLVIATNERIRVIAGTAAGAASSMYVSAIGRRVSP